MKSEYLGAKGVCGDGGGGVEHKRPHFTPEGVLLVLIDAIWTMNGVSV